MLRLRDIALLPLLRPAACQDNKRFTVFKKEQATIRVVEHLYRWYNWTVTQESQPHRQADSRTIEYEVNMQPDEEKTLTYAAHYSR